MENLCSVRMVVIPLYCKGNVVQLTVPRRQEIMIRGPSLADPVICKSKGMRRWKEKSVSDYGIDCQFLYELSETRVIGLCSP